MGAAVLSTAALVGIQETFAQGCLGIAGSGGSCPPASLDARLRASQHLSKTPAGHVEELLQLPEFPSGCESASLAIVLRSFGFDTSIAELVDGYFSYDDSWEHAELYQGDPRGSGSAMPPAVVAAAERYLSERSSKLVATDLTGTSFTKIKSMVKRGLPVMVWSTIDAETPVYTSLRTDVEGYPWYRNFHCVVLYGVDGNDALVSDPLEGLVRRDLAWFTILHRACGLMAASIDVAS